MVAKKGGIKYEIISDIDANRFDLLERCNEALKSDFLTIKFGLGESIYLSEVYKILNDVPGVTDTRNVEFYNIQGGAYSNYIYDIDSNISRDGRYLLVPPDSAAEVLFPDTDILGVIV